MWRNYVLGYAVTKSGDGEPEFLLDLCRQQLHLFPVEHTPGSANRLARFRGMAASELKSRPYSILVLVVDDGSERWVWRGSADSPRKAPPSRSR